MVVRLWTCNKTLFQVDKSFLFLISANESYLFAVEKNLWKITMILNRMMLFKQGHVEDHLNYNWDIEYNLNGCHRISGQILYRLAKSHVWLAKMNNMMNQARMNYKLGKPIPMYTNARVLMNWENIITYSIIDTKHVFLRR